jgi:hypothetical protein
MALMLRMNVDCAEYKQNGDNMLFMEPSVTWPVVHSTLLTRSNKRLVAYSGVCFEIIVHRMAKARKFIRDGRDMCTVGRLEDLAVRYDSPSVRFSLHQNAATIMERETRCSMNFVY